jgi:GntR family transcriptional regulator
VQGRGTFVNQEALEINVKLNISPGFEEMIRKSGYEAEVKLIDFRVEKAGVDVAKKLQIDEADEIVHIEKMFYADGNPAIFCIDRFPSEFLDQPLKEENARKSIYEILHKRAGQKAVRDVTEIFNIQTDRDMKLADVFKSKEIKSLLVLDSVNINQEGKAILYDTEYYDTEYIKFSICRKKDINYID